MAHPSWSISGSDITNKKAVPPAGGFKVLVKNWKNKVTDTDRGDAKALVFIGTAIYKRHIVATVVAMSWPPMALLGWLKGDWGMANERMAWAPVFSHSTH